MKSWRVSGRISSVGVIIAKLDLYEHGNADMKPRLFSTLRALQHENPLVRPQQYLTVRSNVKTVYRDCRVLGVFLVCGAVFPNDAKLKMFAR
jgi:hypothetical protein